MNENTIFLNYTKHLHNHNSNNEKISMAPKVCCSKTCPPRVFNRSCNNNPTHEDMRL